MRSTATYNPVDPRLLKFYVAVCTYKSFTMDMYNIREQL